MMDPDEAMNHSNVVLGRVGYDRRALPESLRVVNLIGWVDYEVALGGVYGWLINMGEYGSDTAKAFEAVGAHQCAALIREILAFFPESKPSPEGRERVQQMEDIGEPGEIVWRELGNRLLERPDDIYALLDKFIAEHAADFT